MNSLQRNGLKVRLFQAVMALANWLAALPNKMVPPPFRVMQMGSAYWQSRALYVAVELGLADAIGDGEGSVAELAAELHLHEGHLYRLMRMLASLGVFIEGGERRFRNSKLSHCLRRDHPQSVRAMVLLHNSSEMSRPWFEELGPSMRSGEPPFLLCHGEELFDYMDNHSRFDALFSEAMEAVESLTGTDYLQDFDWGRFERLIDVGGSTGKKSIAILEHHPQLHALVFDRQQVVATAAEGWRGRVDESLLERIEFVGGDMFTALPPAISDRDLFLFMAIFHGLGDEEALLLLQRLKQACSNYHPAIVIVDTIAQSTRLDPNIAAFDMQMLIGTRGRERTLAEWQLLLQQGGFVLSEVVTVRTFARMLVVQLA